MEIDETYECGCNFWQNQEGGGGWIKCPLHTATPELLEALEVAEVLIARDIVRDDAGCLAKIRAATAKAKGHAQ